MALIEWKDEFLVGIADVDLEHRELIALINELHDAISGDNTAFTILNFLGEIFVHVSAHFALEERIMREQHYDQYQEHKHDHERLLDEIRDIMDDYEENAYYNDAEFSEHLEQWFINHFKAMDARLHKHLGA